MSEPATWHEEREEVICITDCIEIPASLGVFSRAYLTVATVESHVVGGKFLLVLWSQSDQCQFPSQKSAKSVTMSLGLQKVDSPSIKFIVKPSKGKLAWPGNQEKNTEATCKVCYYTRL